MMCYVILLDIVKTLPNRTLL